MSKVVDIRKADDPRDVIHRAVALLSEGKLVAFPTETYYMVGAHALEAKGIERLASYLGADAAARPPLVLKGAQEAIDYVPHMPAVGQKLSRRCWPGPVILSFDVKPREGLLSALPEATRRMVAPDDVVHLRVPAQQVPLNALRWMPAPIVAAPETGGRISPAASAAELLERAGDHIEMIIDDGACRYGEAATVAHVTEKGWEMVAPGVVTETMLSRMASDVYLFVCTGNTCRSPMAEGLFRKMLSERLKCTEDELFDRGYLVASAGISAAVGAPASPETIALMGRRGVDLSGHASQPVTNQLLDQADHIFTMTGAHRDAILALRPELADRVRHLSREKIDICDPIGGGMEHYELCEREIESHLQALIDEIPLK